MVRCRRWATCVVLVLPGALALGCGDAFSPELCPDLASLSARETPSAGFEVEVSAGNPPDTSRAPPVPASNGRLTVMFDARGWTPWPPGYDIWVLPRPLVTGDKPLAELLAEQNGRRACASVFPGKNGKVRCRVPKPPKSAWYVLVPVLEDAPAPPICLPRAP